MNLKTKLVPIKNILIEDRLRVDMGEVAELAASIHANGLFHPPVVDGLGDNQYKLLAGGRRMAALTLLNSNKVEGVDSTAYDNVPVTVYGDLTEDQKIVIEIEENIRRKEMTWKETLRGIVRYHKAKKRAALLEGDDWSQAMTGKLLNMNQAKVSIAFKVYAALESGNEKVVAAENLNDAIKCLLSDELDAADAEKMRRIQLKRAELAAASAKGNGNPAAPGSSPQVILGNGNAIDFAKLLDNSQPTGGVTGLPAASSSRVQFSPSDVASFYHHGNALELLPLLAKNTTINHIVCDPPYGIDMSNLQGTSISRVADTHEVQSNLQLLPEFLRVAYDSIALDGFLCMWYDLDHHEKIAEWAKKVGWKVCRWPLTWCKTSPCQNQSSQYNITKATEVCYFFRRSEESIIKTKQSKNFIITPAESTSTHPFVKPYEVWKYLIETVSTEGQVVVDPFAGEGSSLATMFKLGRIPIGIEIDDKHIAKGYNYVADQINERSILDDVILPPL